MNKEEICKLFVGFVNSIGLLKQYGRREEDSMGKIGAYQLHITQLQHDSSLLNHDDEIQYYREAIVKEEMTLSDVQSLYRNHKRGSGIFHQELVHAAFVEQKNGQHYFLLPPHTTFGQRTLVPGFNSMMYGDADTIQFIEVRRELDADKQGAYLVYPTMGEADFGTIA